MKLPGLVCALAAALLACGDNTKECGDGTVLERGYCVLGEPAAPTCTGGTVLDEVSRTCVIDEGACQDGTVLIDGACKDPTAGLIVDLIEGLEPNGFGVAGESSPTPAGLITLKPAGQPGVILKGNIAPRADRDGDGELEPDFDTYLVDVSGPTLLAVSADGVHGLAGGFVAYADAGELTSWSRFGINLTGDTAQRQLYLPAAGRYRLAIADTRSLVLGAAVGDEGTEYYVTIAQLPVPTATQLPATVGLVHHTGALAPGTPQLFAADLGTGDSQLTLATDNDGLTGGLVLVVDGAVHSLADEVKSSMSDVPATLVAGGLAAGAPALIIVDPVIAATTQPVAFTLDLEINPASPP